MTDDRKTIEELIEASSLGTPAAKALRARCPPEARERARQLAEEIVSHHTHPRGRATVWSGRTLLTHLREKHGITPQTRNVITLERDHAAEHPEMEQDP